MVFVQTYKPAKRSIRRSTKEDSEKTREEIYSKVGGRGGRKFAKAGILFDRSKAPNKLPSYMLGSDTK